MSDALRILQDRLLTSLKRLFSRGAVESDIGQQVRTLHGEKRFRSALGLLLAGLERSPDSKRLLNLAGAVLGSGLSRELRYKALEPLTEEQINNHLLDSLFCECSRCGRYWVSSAALLADSIKSITGENIVMSTIDGGGGRCPKCAEVFCIECAVRVHSDSSSRLSCPRCNGQLEALAKPNGRNSRQLPRRKKPPICAVLLREGPIPPDEQTVRDLFRKVSPDVIDQGIRTVGLAVPEWPGDDELFWKLALNQCAAWGIFPMKDAIDTYILNSGDGTRCYVFKVY